MARFLILFGPAILLVGLLWPYLSRIGLGRLPGDIVIERDNGTFYFPLMTCLILSLLFSFVLWLVNRWLHEVGDVAVVLPHFADPAGQSLLVFASTGNLAGSSCFSPRGPKCSRTMSSSEGRPSSRWLSNSFRRSVASGISLILRGTVTRLLMSSPAAMMGA